GLGTGQPGAGGGSAGDRGTGAGPVRGGGGRGQRLHPRHPYPGVDAARPAAAAAGRDRRDRAGPARGGVIPRVPGRCRPFLTPPFLTPPFLTHWPRMSIGFRHDLPRVPGTAPRAVPRSLLVRLPAPRAEADPAGHRPARRMSAPAERPALDGEDV